MMKMSVRTASCKQELYMKPINWYGRRRTGGQARRTCWYTLITISWPSNVTRFSVIEHQAKLFSLKREAWFWKPYTTISNPADAIRAEETPSIAYIRIKIKVIETGSIQKLGCGFLFAFHSNYSRICSHFGDVQRQRMAWPWNLGMGSFKVIEKGAVR